MNRFISYVSVERALSEVKHEAPIMKKLEFVDSFDAFGRTLARDVVALQPVPPNNISHMDGYAVRVAEIASADPKSPVALKVTAETRLWDASVAPLEPRSTIRVPTGGILPRNADCVVPTEEVRFKGGRAIFDRPFKRGIFVYPRGTDVPRGELVFRRGHRVRAQDVAMFAKLNVKRLAVYRIPRVGILATGSELLAPPRSQSRGSLETHSHILFRLIEKCGGLPVRLGIAPDDKDKIASILLRATKGNDLLLTIGGSSVGSHDKVTEAVNSIGRPGVLCHGIKLDRGRVAGVAAVDGKPVVILPGPIQGAMNAFFVLAIPLIAELGGSPSGPELKVDVKMTVGWKARKDFEDFVKVVYLKLREKDGIYKATPIVGETETTSVVTKSNAYAVLPRETASLAKGAHVVARLLPGFSL